MENDMIRKLATSAAAAALVFAVAASPALARDKKHNNMKGQTTGQSMSPSTGGVGAGGPGSSGSAASGAGNGGTAGSGAGGAVGGPGGSGASGGGSAGAGAGGK